MLKRIGIQVKAVKEHLSNVENLSIPFKFCHRTRLPPLVFHKITQDHGNVIDCRLLMVLSVDVNIHGLVYVPYRVIINDGGIRFHQQFQTGDGGSQLWFLPSRQHLSDGDKVILPSTTGSKWLAKVASNALMSIEFLKAVGALGHETLEFNLQ